MASDHEVEAGAGPGVVTVRLGFLPLTDCASVVVASALGFDRRHGIRLVLSREPSWATVRDKLLSGELDAAQALYGLVYGVHLGIGGPRCDMSVLMGLSANGQGITLSRRLLDRGVTDGPTLAAHVRRYPREVAFATTFPTGTHTLWLYHWLSLYGIDPLRDVSTLVVPPPRMAQCLRDGTIDGFCAGEPWNAEAVATQAGFTVATSQSLWPGHPEKALAVTAGFAARRAQTCIALVRTLLDAARYTDEPANRAEVARLLSAPEYLGMPETLIAPRLTGVYDDGNGHQWQDPEAVQFFGGGSVTYPWLSDGMWFVSQLARWRMLGQTPDLLAAAEQVQRIDLYSAAAQALGVPLPPQPVRAVRLQEGSTRGNVLPFAAQRGHP